MTLIFTDGFDHYTTLTQKWNSTSAGTISAVTPRSGSGCLLTTTGNMVKQVAAASEHATFILGLGIQSRGIVTSTTWWAQIAFLSDSFATTHVTIQILNSGEIKAFRGTTAGTLLGTAAVGSLPNNGSWRYLEIKTTLHDTTGIITIKVDGTAVLTLTGLDTKNAGTKTTFDSIAITGTGNSIGGQSVAWDDLYLLNGAGSINNDFLGDCKIETLYPSGDGNSSQLVGSDGNSTSNYLLVDETPPNTSDYNGSAVDNNFDLYAMGNLATTSGAIYGAVVLAYAAKSDAGAAGGAIMLRHGSTDYEKTDNALSTTYTYYSEVLEQDPTAVTWTISNINALEVGFKKKAS